MENDSAVPINARNARLSAFSSKRSRSKALEMENISRRRENSIDVNIAIMSSELLTEREPISER